MAKLFIEDLDIKGKKVLLRADLNVPLDGNNQIADATRIEASLPTIQYLLDNGAAVILMSHLGRPQGQWREELSLEPVAHFLKELLKEPVIFAPDCIGEKVRNLTSKLNPGELLLLENLRFHRGEEHPEEDPSFAQELASYGNCYINDAFGAAHRKHSSTYTIAQYFPALAAAGFLLEKEIRILAKILEKPDRPFFAILGGAKVSSKIGVIQALLQRVDCLLIGGGMAYTFLKAEGHLIGDSLIENDLIPLAKSFLKEYRNQIVLPIDLTVATSCSEDASAKTILCEEGIPQGYQGVDIGPQTIQRFKDKLVEAKTILWNGTLGVYELDPFAKGTLSIARYLSTLKATTVIAGGHSIAAVNQAGVSEGITHLATGGGATLEYIEYGTLPGIEALSNT